LLVRSKILTLDFLFILGRQGTDSFLITIYDMFCWQHLGAYGIVEAFR
jgi:hypothetical protein